MKFKLKTAPKATSIRYKMFLILLALFLCQMVAIMIVINLSGMLDLIDNETYRIFNEQTVSHSDSLSKSLRNISASAVSAAENISDKLAKTSEANEISPSELYLHDNLFKDASSYIIDVMIDLINQNTVSGAFVIFEKSNFSKNDTDKQSVIWIRDSSPGTVARNNSDLHMLRGIGDLAKKRQISLHANWGLDFSLSESVSSTDFYYTPVQIAKINKNAELGQLGYWAEPLFILNDNGKVITYTVPLIDSVNNVIGVFGIEITVSAISQFFMPSSELTYGNSFYAMGSYKNNEILTDWIIPGTPLAGRYISSNPSSIPIELVNDTYSVYTATLKNGSASETWCVSLRNLDLYSDRSPYKNLNFSFMGFVNQNNLLSQSKSTAYWLFISLFISLVLGIGIIAFSSFYLTKAIVSLPDTIKSLDYSRTIEFERTNIYEINELMNAIEDLYGNLKKSTERMSHIMELTRMPVASYEADTETGMVFITSIMIPLLNLDIPQTSYISYEYWDRIYKKILSGYDEKNDAYLWINNKELKWLRLNSYTEKSKNLGIIMDITDEIERHIELIYLLEHDSLTGLLNIKTFNKRVEQRINIEGSETIGAMIYVDLDNLKFINDSYGHDVGDLYICQASEMLNYFDELNGLSARISGDEFAIYIDGFITYEEAENVVYGFLENRLNTEFIAPDELKIRIRFSTGIAWFPKDSITVDELRKYAGYALFEAKNSMKGAIFEFNLENYLKSGFILEKGEQINQLIDDQLIQFAFQPIVDLRTEKIYAYEALMRPMTKEFKSPLEILAVAASQFKLYQIERLVFFKAGQWLEQNYEALGDRLLFVNSISSQILRSNDFVRLKEKYCSYFNKVVIEFTESEDERTEILDRKIELARDVLKAKIAIDDYGSGYSNQVRVLTVNPDLIKIDISLVHDVDIDVNKQSIISDIVEYSRTRDILVLAEGVETENELKKIMELNIPLIQGYYFGKPDFEMSEVEPAKLEKIRELKRIIKNDN